MSSEVDLLRDLDDEPDTPSTVDLRRAIATARRRRRLRRGAGYAGAAAVTVFAVVGVSVAGGLLPDTKSPQAAATGTPRASAKPEPKPAYTIPGTPGWTAPAAAAPTRCTLEVLPAPDDAPMALVSGADPAGRFLVGRSYPEGGGYQAVLWRDGAAEKVMLPGDLEESLQDVNSGGTAVGWSYAKDGPVPYAYRDGKVTKLAGTRNGSAYAINDAGAIAGDDNAGHPVVWTSLTAKPTRLPVPRGTTEAKASDIDEDGTVVGSLGLDRPYVWFADGTHRELPMPVLNGKPAAVAMASHVRNGWATGMAGGDRRGGPVAAARWNLRTGTAEIIDDLKYPADAVNAHGWQVGTDAKGYAVLRTDTATVRLPGLAKHRSDGTSTIANVLSDDGRTVAGQSDDSSGTIQAVVWRCG